jgi:RNA recognition motif-containing protein
VLETILNLYIKLVHWGINMNHKRLYVGDLPAAVTEGQLQDLFGEAGGVESVSLMRNSSVQTFAFIEMTSPEAAREAIKRFNGQDFEGTRLIVYAVPPKSRPREAVRTS